MLKDFVGKVEAKKICDAGSLIVRLRDIIIYMTNMGISLTCLAEMFTTFAITDEEKNMIGPDKNSLKQLLVWIRERAAIQGTPEATTGRCITEAVKLLKEGKVLGELHTRIISEWVPRIMSARDGNLILTQDRVSWKKHEGFELFKKAVKEYSQDLYDQVERETGWRSDLDIKDLAKRFEPWLMVERRQTDQKESTFCSLIEMQELRQEMEAIKATKNLNEGYEESV